MHNFGIATLPFDRQESQTITVRGYKACVPHLLGSPNELNTGSYQELLRALRYKRILLQRIHHQSKVVEIALRPIVRRSMAVISVKIRLVAYLEPDEVVSENGLTLLHNTQTEVGRIVEGHTEMPPHVHVGRYVAKHVEELRSEYERGCLRLVEEKVIKF